MGNWNKVKRTIGRSRLNLVHTAIHAYYRYKGDLYRAMDWPDDEEEEMMEKEIEENGYSCEYCGIAYQTMYTVEDPKKKFAKHIVVHIVCENCSKKPEFENCERLKFLDVTQVFNNPFCTEE